MTQPSPTQHIKPDITWRVRVLYVIFVGLAMLIIGRIIYIQYGPDGDALRHKGEENNFNVFRVEGSRGDIYSDDMSLIATSQQRYMVGIDFGARGFSHEKFAANVPVLARQMSAMFGDRSAAGYERLLNSMYANRARRRYVRITPRWVSYLELKQIEGFAQIKLPPNVGGRGVESEVERVRPFGMLAARTIGKTTTDLVWVDKPTKQRDSTAPAEQLAAYEVRPVSGLENSYNDLLKGTNGWELRQKINQNFWVPVESEVNVAPSDGADIVTTLDMNIQDVAESMLSKQLLQYDADWGTVVVMEVATGEIKAIANLGNNHHGSCSENFNYAVSGSYEPGSTFKLASLLALLEKGGMTLTDKVSTEHGHAVIDNRIYDDDHKVDTAISVKTMFALSSNIGFVKSVRGCFRANPSMYVDFIKSLGFKQQLHTGIKGETKPQMWEPTDRGANQWTDNLTLNKMAYGYSFNISPLHTLTLYNAVANGGKMVRPHFVREVRRYGQVVEEFKPEYINEKICSDATLASVRECLESVVDSGTGMVLKNPYYQVAAKTGTAQMLFYGSERNPSNPYYDKAGHRQYLATMVGYFPADNPKYSCIVCIKTYSGRTYNIYGAGMAGPVFRAVADRIYAAHSEWQPSVAERYTAKSPKPADVKGGRYDAVSRVASDLQFLYQGGATGEWVATQNDSTRIVLSKVPTIGGLVPNTVGMGAQDALYLIERCGMKAVLHGKGRVVSQSVPSGSNIIEGGTIVLILK